MKVSIITINYNNVVGLQTTIQSVINQTFTDYEYIIVDGGSHDGSKELIAKYADRLTYWISEKDTGIYNAMNKGIKQANGEYCFFLNSGDAFFSNSTLEEVFKFDLLDNEIIYGSACFFDNNRRLIVQFPEKLSMAFFMNDMICHQALLFKKSFFIKYGIYDEQFKLASDWVLLVKGLYNHASYMKIDCIICLYDCNGRTASIEGLKLLQEERRYALDINLPFVSNEIKELDKLKHELEAIRKMFLVRVYKWIKNCFK